MLTRLTGAKPDGCTQLTREEALSLLSNEGVRALPGIGWAVAKKLSALGIETCCMWRLLSLQVRVS